ncbi:unnamed protein product [Protopolystoma xenopodis]|uniref:Uncharacterized protein n=1 Tax=Protopolystoma xenopodis TaxID=117903 RepID=A0A448WY89_9PLAT|nr:unnamed protein product [Protopolystoma xenopodis]
MGAKAYFCFGLFSYPDDIRTKGMQGQKRKYHALTCEPSHVGILGEYGFSGYEFLSQVILAVGTLCKEEQPSFCH